MGADERSRKARLADILAGGLLAVLWASACEKQTISTEQALEELEHVLDEETKQLVTAHLRRRAREIAKALVRIAEGDDDASFEAERALEELRQLLAK